MPASSENPPPPPPSEQSPTALGRWAAQNAQHDDELLALTAGVSRNRLADCRRIVRELQPEIARLVDQDHMPLSSAVLLCRLKTAEDQILMATAMMHEKQVAGRPINAERVRAIIDEYRRNPSASLQEAMNRIAGVRFQDSPTILVINDNLPQLYRAAWQWGDASVAEYVAKAPARLAELTQALQHATSGKSILTAGGDTIDITSTISITPAAGTNP